MFCFVLFFGLVKGLATWDCTCASSSHSYWFMYNIRVIPSIAGTYRVISGQCGPAVLLCLYQRLDCLWSVVFQHVSEECWSHSPPFAFVVHMSVCESRFSHFYCLWITYCEGNCTPCFWSCIPGCILVLLCCILRFHLKLCNFTISNRAKAVRVIVLGLYGT